MNKKAFFTLCLGMFVGQLGLGIVVPLIPLYAKNMGASGIEIGVMVASFAVSRLVLMPVMGRISDFGGRKKAILIGLAGYTITSLLYVAASNIYHLMLVRFLQGATTSLVIPAAQAYVGDLTPKGKEGTYINIFSMFQFLGMGTGPLLGGVMAEFWSMNAAFYSMGIISLSAMFMFIFLVPEFKPAKHTGKPRASILTILRDGRIKGLYVFRASRAFWRQGVTGFLPIFAAGLGIGEALIGLIISIYMNIDGVGQAFAGPLTDRFSKLKLLVIFSILAPVLLYLVPFSTTAIAMILILLPVALLDSVSRASALAINVEIGKDYQGMGVVMGLFHSAMDLGAIVGPIVFGFAADIFGVESTFSVGATVGIIATLVTLYYFIQHRRTSLRTQSLTN